MSSRIIVFIGLSIFLIILLVNSLFSFSLEENIILRREFNKLNKQLEDIDDRLEDLEKLTKRLDKKLDKILKEIERR